MAAKKKDLRTAPSDDADERGADIRDEDGRDKELCEDTDIRDAALEIYKDVESGFGDQAERTDEIQDFWDIYNCKLGGKQFYNGNSQIFLPIVRDAVKARKTRFVNQIFPQSGRYVECITSEDQPDATVSLLEHYIRRARLRSGVLPTLIKKGDIEGQYNIYVSWIKTERHVASRVKKGGEMDGVELDEGDTEDVEEETLTHGRPHVEVIPDGDILILPQTADSIEDALEAGGSVTIIRRWSKAKIKQMVADGQITEKAGDELIDRLGKKENDKDGKKKMIDAAGIRGSGEKKYAQVYETWSKLKVEDERRLCRLFFGGDDLVTSVKRNPFWHDRCPLISASVEKESGAFKGVSNIKPVADMQYGANDAVNEGMDSAAYALMPIIMTDPAKNPRVGTMVLNVAAIWETSPNDTKFANFPQLWKEAFEIVNAYKNQIFQSLSVNPAMVPQAMMGKKKMNQAEIANEQSVDIMTTADVVTYIEGEILTPMLYMFVWLDHQFRDEAITVREFGEMGMQRNMQEVKPIQMNRRFEFRWFGVEAARQAQKVQMQVAAVNVLRQFPPQSYQGYELNLAPVIQNLVESTFGARLSAQIFKSLRYKYSMAPEKENVLLLDGFPYPTNPNDDDMEHVQKHQQVLGEDSSGVVREHIARHMMQMAMKAQAQMQQQLAQMGGGPQGSPQPGGGGPRPGAAPGQQRGGQQPPGAIHQDRLRDPSAAPRR